MTRNNLQGNSIDVDVSLVPLNGEQVAVLEGSAKLRLSSRSNVIVLRTAIRPTRADANKTGVCLGGDAQFATR